MITRVEHNTIRAIEKMSKESQDGDVAKLFQLIKQTNEALEEQSKFLSGLDKGKVIQILKISKENPDLAPIVPLLEAFQEIAVTAVAWQEPETTVKVGGEVDFLTTGDVSFLLGVSPQQVRTYCQNGDIVAWRTNRNRGEWRIQVDQFVNNPRFKELLKQKEIAKERNTRILRTLHHLSQEQSYTDMIDRIEKERADNTGGQTK